MLHAHRCVVCSEDDLGYLWDLAAEDPTVPVAKLEGHQDSVVCAEFSADGRYVATGAMNGAIKFVSPTRAVWCIHLVKSPTIYVVTAGCGGGGVYMRVHWH